MEKRLFIFWASIFFFLTGAGFSTYACDPQNDTTVDLTVTIIPGINVEDAYCYYSFSAGLSDAVYELHHYQADGTTEIIDNLTGSRSIGDKLNSSANPSTGYYFELSDGNFFIRKNPANSGVFVTGDSLVWKLTISNVPLSGTPLTTTISGLSTACRDAGQHSVSGGGSISSFPCNTKPTVNSISASPDTTAPLVMDLAAVEANDTDGTITHYHWDFGDSSANVDSAAVNHPYLSDGRYQVTLQVEDNQGALSYPETTTYVDTNQRPNLSGIDAQISTTKAMEVTLSAVFPPSPTPRDPDDGDDVQAFNWDFGDGTHEDGGNGSVSHTYATDGDKTVKLWVKDSHNLSSDSNTATSDADPVTITVNPNAAPVVDIAAVAVAPSSIIASGSDIFGAAPLLLSASPVVTSNDDTMSGYDWTLDGGSSTTTPLQFNDIGVHPISLVGRDGYTIPSAPATKTVYVLPDAFMHFARALGVPYDSQVSPHVDGILAGYDNQAEPPGQPDAGQIYGENGWRGAYQQVYGSSTAGSDVIFQGIEDHSANVLYFSFEVTYDYSLDSDDQIILGFRGNSDDPTVANSTSDRLISFDMGAVRENVADSVGIQVKKRGTGPNDGWTVVATCPPGLKCAKQSLTANKWTIEIEVPMDADAGSGWEAIASRFLFFYQVRRTISGGQTTPDYSRWPTALDGKDFFIDEASDPSYTWQKTRLNPLWWGEVDMSSTLPCNGLALDSASNVGSIPVDKFATPRYDPASLAQSGSLTSGFKFTDPTGSTPTTYTNQYTNIVVARVKNDTQVEEIDGAGAIQRKMLNVPNVSVSVKIANWGIPPAPGTSYWHDIPGSPTSPVKTVPRDPTTEPTGYSSSGDAHYEPFWIDWPMSYAEATRYMNDTADGDAIDERHQCIYVEVSATPNADDPSSNIQNPRIVTKSVHRNMNFDAVNEGAKFVHKADISALGYGIPPDGGPDQKFILRIFTRTWQVDLGDEKNKAVLESKPERAGIAAASLRSRIPAGMPAAFHDDLLRQKDVLLRYAQNGTKVVSYIEYIVRGFLFTGKTATVNGKTLEVVRAVGSYGHLVHHEGRVEDWDFQITGEGVTRLNKDTYLLKIPAEQTKRVFDNVKAREPPRWELHAGGGATFPMGTLAATHGLGWNAFGGIGYHPWPELSLHLLGGYSYLPAQGASTAAAQSLDLSLNARAHAWLGTFISPYAGGGFGIYTDPGFSTISKGVNACAGADIKLLFNLMIEAGLEYHYVFDTGAELMRVNLGAVARF
jgi:PKD repeat protein